MREIKNFELSALKEYNPPKYPTYQDAKADPALLRKLPSRWKKNIGAFACAALLSGAIMTGGCFIPGGGNGNYNGNGNNGNGGHYTENGSNNNNKNNGNNNNGNNNGNINIDDIIASGGGFHHGGSGVSIYIVYLTEQEAIDVIRGKAEYLGLPMRDTPPNVSVTVSYEDFWGMVDREVGLNLFNADKNIGISHVGNMRWNNQWIASEAQEMFDAKNNDLTVGVFHGGVEAVNNPENFYIGRPPTETERAEISERLKQHLTAQVREFIEWLQAAGIIQ